MRIRRGCYDKFHRCPGWAGSGWYYPDYSITDHGCDNGYIETDGKRLWRWRFIHCSKCDIVVLPYMSRWLDPSWLKWWFKE